ncbi:MAG: carboxymuconolactone decarboxylase family protein [Tetrasphaera sp.]
MSRFNISKKQPAVYQRLADFSGAAEEAAKAAGLDPKLVELVKIRVSQLNGCAFCLRMHTRDALKLGETSDRLAVLAAWWESQYFAPAEQAALALAEQSTRLTVPEPEVDASALTDEQIAAVTWLAVVMNAWNRVAIRSGYPVGP